MEGDLMDHICCVKASASTTKAQFMCKVNLSDIDFSSQSPFLLVMVLCIYSAILKGNFDI